MKRMSSLVISFFVIVWVNPCQFRQVNFILEYVQLTDYIVATLN